MKKFKEDDTGCYEWIDAGFGAGYYRKIEDEQTLKDRVPIKCIACNGGYDLWCVPFHHRNGVCAECSVIYLDKKEDGGWTSRHPNSFFKNRDEKVAYCKEQILLKKKRIEEMSKLENS